MIEVKYRIAQAYCPCCERDFEEEKISDVRVYELSEKTIEAYDEWKDYIKWGDNLNDSIENMLYDELNYYVLGIHDLLRVRDEEINKIADYIKEKYKG